MTQNNNKQQNVDEPISVVRVSGSKGIEDHVVQNIVNNNPATRFSSKGIGAFFDIEYNKEIEFNTLYLILFRGAQRKTTFSVAYTNDFIKFKPTKPTTFTSSGADSYGEYHFHKVKAKGIRVSFEGHVVNTTTGYDQVKQGGNSGVQSATNPGQSIGQTGDSSADSDYFSVIGASLTNTELTKEQEKQLKEHAKLDKEQEECKDCKCLRCGCDCDDGICENCGIKGHYEHSPISVQNVDHIVDTTPSPSQPQPINLDENARHVTTVPPGAPAQAGNIVDKGIEIDKNVATGKVPPAKDNIVGKRSEQKVTGSEASKNNTAREVTNNKVDNAQTTTGIFNTNNNNNNSNKDLGPTFHTEDPQSQSNNNNVSKANNKNENAAASTNNKFSADKADSSFSTASSSSTTTDNNKNSNKKSNIKEGDTVETQTTIVDKKDVK